MYYAFCALTYNAICSLGSQASDTSFIVLRCFEAPQNVCSLSVQALAWMFKGLVSHETFILKTLASDKMLPLVCGRPNQWTFYQSIKVSIVATTVRFKCLMCTKGGLALCSAELVLNYKYKGDKSCFYDLYSGCHKSFIDLH